MARTLTLTYDYVEGGDIFAWVRAIAQGDAQLRNLSVIEESSPGNETGRTNYFEVFPISYQQFTGFGQDVKLKERVVLAYALSEPG